MTNRQKLTNKELAEMMIKERWEYGTEPSVYKTRDGEIYEDKTEAIQHTVDWLNKEVDDEN